MKDFLEHTYHVITTSMDRFFYVKQNKLGQGLKKKPQEIKNNDDKDFDDIKSVRSLNMLQKYASKSTLRELLKNQKKNMTAIHGKVFFIKHTFFLPFFKIKFPFYRATSKI
jgi:hypothetical protein